MLVTNPGSPAVATAATLALLLGNVALLRGVRGRRTPSQLERLARATALLDLTVAIVWVVLDIGGNRPGVQMYAALGLVGVEVAGLFGRVATFAFLVAIMAILGGTDVATHNLFGRPVQLADTILRVALLWSVVLMARALISGVGNRRREGAAEGLGSDRARVEAGFQAVLDGTPSAIIAADDAGVVVMVNAAALRLFGHTRREIIGKPASTLVPGLYRDLPHGSGARYLAREVLSAGADKAWQGTRRDGTAFPAEVSYSTLQIGQQVLVAASIRDITDRVRAEEERDAFKAQLDEAQRLDSLGRLAGGIAHDFNNMLNVILNYTEFVEEATRSNPAIKADLGEIRSAGKRAARLTQQLLRLAGREALRAEPIDLAGVVAAMDGRLRSMLPPGGRLKVVIPGSLPSVRADPTMVSEVLGILVDNAAQATEGAGEIVIRATEITVTPGMAAQQPDLSARRYVVMSVVDRGVGMDEATRAGALEPFFTTRAEAGRGLGLPTAYGLVRQSGGALLIESAPRSGTTVKVYLPIAVDGDVTDGSASPIDQEPLSARRVATTARQPDMILLMDHDDVTRGDTANMLIRNHFDVVEARDAAEALRLAVEEQHRIKLVIIDRVMGSMVDTGLPEMIKALLPDAKLILVSVFSRQMLSSQGLDDPSVPFMTKDYSEADLVKRVRGVLGPAPRPRSASKRK